MNLAHSQTLSPGFESQKVIGNLIDPASFAFAPDGRLFYGERITGKIKVATYNASSGQFESLNTAFHQLPVPTIRHRSSGVRGFVFDPDYSNNGYLYVFYMQNNPRHNRVVRIQASAANANISTGTETILLELPYNATTSSGSHNGGDLVFGQDGKLYFTTGDGWNGGDNVQSLSTYTGKVMRINKDGTIPNDNPFYNQTTGSFRAIYALGLRNPYSVSNLSATSKIYINDAVGTNKASVFELQPGANYGHDGYGGIGTNTNKWADMSVSGESVVTGGLWYPSTGYWPSIYHGNYFAAFWGSNSANAPGAITRALSETNITKSSFYNNMLIGGELKPVMLKYGNDGNIYYLMTDYETGVGEIYKIKYVGTNIVSSPSFSPLPGQYNDPVNVSLSNSDPSSTIYYTTDGSNPQVSGIAYSIPINIASITELKAIAIEAGKTSSETKIGQYNIGPVPNLAPIANVVPKLNARKSSEVTLNGSKSYDPDGTAVSMQESWHQTFGPIVTINDNDETVANFTPTQEGIYEFKLIVEDIYGAKDSTLTSIYCFEQIDDYLDNLIARWSFEDNNYSIAYDTSPNGNSGILENVTLENTTGDGSEKSVFFNAVEDRIDIDNLDITGNELTICFWTKLSNYNQSDARFISKASGQFDVDHYWMVSTLDNSKIRFRLKTDVGGTATLISAANEVPLNQWIFIAATYDGSTMKIFKDSTLLSTQNKTGIIASSPAIYAALGNQPSTATGGNRPLNGNLDEVRIYGKALTINQIKQVIKSGSKKLCWKNLTLPSTKNYPNQIETSETIIGTNQLISNQNLTFSAGKSIQLSAPFSVEAGAVFTSKIEGCLE